MFPHAWFEETWKQTVEKNAAISTLYPLTQTIWGDIQNTHLRKAQQMKLISLMKNKFSDSDKMSSISQSVHKMPENAGKYFEGILWFIS